MFGKLSRRAFVVASSAALATARKLSAADAEKDAIIGPLLGHVDANTAALWARIPQAGRFTIQLTADGGDAAPQQSAEFSASTDFTGRWRFDNLKPGTKYRFRTVDAAKPLGRELEGSFRTAPAPDAPARVSLAFGSCAREDKKSRGVWERMQSEEVDGVVLLGDTPYIDKTDLATQRLRYRQFQTVPEFQKLMSGTPLWGTWDDHDFGKNDADGRLPGKEHARQAFCEYRALANFGDGETGIYTKFRHGPVEVFVIDARWFANTGPSPVDPKKPTLLGAAQWEWLQAGLAASTAPWKVLCCGMIWDAKRNGEKDHWETYAHERRAIFDFIRDKKIPGVVLIGGDIHVSRVLRYDAKKTVGYPLYQFITSPIHDRVIPQLNESHPDLLHSAVKPHTFLKLTCDTTGPEPQLAARFLNSAGELLFEEIALSHRDATLTT